MKCLMTLTILILAVVISGCGKLRSQRLLGVKVPIPGQIGTIQTPPQRNLTVSELGIASDICLALKAKRADLETKSGKLIYVFALERRNCSNAIVETSNLNALIELITGDLEYSTSDVSTFIVDVVTDKTPAIANICEQIFDTSTKLETKKISNTIVLLAKMYTASFSVNAQAYDTIDITTRIQNSTGAFVPTMAEHIAISTTDSQLGASFKGVEKERTQQTVCKGTEVSTIKESWVKALSTI
jgi:hypothetical protein